MCWIGSITFTTSVDTVDGIYTYFLNSMLLCQPLIVCLDEKNDVQELVVYAYPPQNEGITDVNDKSNDKHQTNLIIWIQKFVKFVHYIRIKSVSSERSG